MARSYYTLEQKRDLLNQAIDIPVTLNGKSAIISGVMLDFAIVRTLDGKQSFEFSWSAVEIVLNKGGMFKG